MTTAMLRDDKQQVTVIKILCTPSMKSDSYWVYLIYKKSDTGERDTLLKTPLSRCDCPAGRFFCSHMLGFLLLLRFIMNNPDDSYVDIVKNLPDPTKSLTRLLIYCSYVFGHDKILGEEIIMGDTVAGGNSADNDDIGEDGYRERY